ncbi:MAG TPA: flagellar motor switch protein FliN [Tepidisphaeraceae bacterium]|jgi:flagellar motor switch protein FliN/FliY
MAEESPPTPDTSAAQSTNPSAESSAPIPTPPSPTPSESVPAAEANPLGDSVDSIDQVSIEELLRQASFEDPSAVGGGPAAEANEFKLPSFQQVIQDAQVSSIDLLRDVELNVKIELGRARMLVEDVLKLSEGSVVELDKLAGDPVDVFVNERLVARGEVLVLNDNFCVRVNEIVAGVKEEGL